MDDPRETVSLELSGNPIPSSIPAERWVQAEAAAKKIVCRVQPTAESDGRRKEVVDYVQRLIRHLCGCEVLPFGSLPLKTYLPDGDIDLTTVGGTSVDDALLNNMVSALQRKYRNKAAEFIVKDVRVVRAEVKLVKCIIQNIVVDISFNQLGGLRTLNFLEQADSLIGKDHLFKRSILMIKAWCYYESRILGAHHGLISTYAMETLILYIFHLFHSELDGPLAVLYRFLDYFSKFDWANYGISLNGPVCISSLPNIVVEKPQNNGSLLLSDEFLKKCSDMYSASSSGVDMSQTFQEKHLNIVDPLKVNNNLGRSVSKGNFFRIRSAFAYGARKLREILLQPEDDVAIELCSFFSNTLSRNRDGQRTDVQEPSSPDGKERSDLGFSNSIPIKEGNIDEVIERAMKIENSTNGHKEGSSAVVSSVLPPKTDDSTNQTADIGYRISGDADEFSTSTDQTPKSSNEAPNENVFQGAVLLHAPHLYFSCPPVVGSKDNDVVSDPVGCCPSLVNPSCKPKTSVTNAVVRPVVLEHLANLGEESEHSVSSSPALPPSEGSSNYSKHDGFSNTNGNVVIPRPDVHHMKVMQLPHALFRAEQSPKPRGTGTYFPKESQSPCQNALTGNGRSPASLASPKSPEQGKGAPPRSDPFKISFPNVKVCLPESNIHLGPASVLAQMNTGALPTTGTQKPKPIQGLKDRLSYRLKNEDDFPPLSA